MDNTHLCLNLDFAPTFLDFARATGAPEVTQMQGQSLRAVLTGRTPAAWRQAIYYRYWMHLAHHHIPGHYGIRTERFKLAFFHGLPLDANSGKGPFPPSTPGWELYDLQTDPHETNNVYRSAQYAPIIRQLKSQLLQLKRDIGDEDERYPELMKLRKIHRDN